ncbi:MAG: acyltransferase family protein [Angustibacter sp.]
MSQAPTRAGRRSAQRDPAIQGMRGFMLLTVVVFHAWQFTEGWDLTVSGWSSTVVLALSWAVSWFFVTSGFLLYRSYAAKVLADRPVGPARAFLIRRMMRVAPAYWVAILVVWSARNPNLPGDWRDLVSHLTFTHIFDRERIFFTIGPAWSLSVEILFYLLLTALWRPLARIAAPYRIGGRTLVLCVPAMALLGAGIGYQVWVVFWSGAPFEAWNIWFHPLAQAPALGIGMLLAVLTVRWRPVIHHPMLAAVPLLGLVALVVVAQDPAWIALISGNPLPFRALSTVVFAAFLAVTVLMPASSGWNRMWSWRPMAWVGTISFSIYLWHDPVLQVFEHWGVIDRLSPFAVVTVLSLVLSLAIGWLMFAVVERPLRLLGELVAPSTPFPDRYLSTAVPRTRAELARSRRIRSLL